MLNKTCMNCTGWDSKMLLFCINSQFQERRLQSQFVFWKEGVEATEIIKKLIIINIGSPYLSKNDKNLT